jgi:hypothetical protein
LILGTRLYFIHFYFFPFPPENGLLSYANPNYHKNPQRMAQNSDTYEEYMHGCIGNDREMPTNDIKNMARKNNPTFAAMGINKKESFK